MLTLTGLNRDQVPALHPSYKAIGSVLPDIAIKTGLPVHTKIVIGGGDQAVGAVGTGTVTDGMCSVSLGTSGVVFAALDSFKIDEGPSAIHSFCHATGKYHMMGVTLGAAASTKWWVEDILGHTGYETEQKSINRAGQSNIYYLPYLNGERTPHNDPDARGTFVGMSLTTTRADLMRAVLEGVAYSLRDIMVRIKELGAEVKSTRIIGGGAKSPLWCQIIADVLGIKVEKINSAEGPAFGAAILAMVGAGVFATVEDACKQLINVTDAFDPNPASVKIYNRNYPIYTDLYKNLQSTFKKMAEVDNEG
jgi:xylulokinase